MKIHATNLLIAVALCALLTYGIVSIGANAMKTATGIGSFISLACTLALAIGVSFDNARVGANMRVVATLSFIGSLVLNVLFAFAGFSQTSYIIVTGIFFLVYVLVANALFAAQK